jgi:hypothetical protein
MCSATRYVRFVPKDCHDDADDETGFKNLAENNDQCSEHEYLSMAKAIS